MHELGKRRFKEQRHKIKKLLKRNPSLKPHLQTLFAEEDIYQDGYLRAILLMFNCKPRN
jgi:hypothetical protein